jgi:hypothetical protein
MSGAGEGKAGPEGAGFDCTGFRTLVGRWGNAVRVRRVGSRFFHS